MPSRAFILGIAAFAAGSLMMYAWSHFYGPDTSASERVIRVAVIAAILFAIGFAIKPRTSG